MKVLTVVLALAAVAPATIVRGQGSGTAVELVSLGTDGLSGNHHSGSNGLIPARTRISADGRYVVFESYASTIVCNNDFSTRDIFVRDRLTGRSTVASVEELHRRGHRPGGQRGAADGLVRRPVRIHRLASRV